MMARRTAGTVVVAAVACAALLALAALGCSVMYDADELKAASYGYDCEFNYSNNPCENQYCNIVSDIESFNGSCTWGDYCDNYEKCSQEYANCVAKKCENGEQYTAEETCDGEFVSCLNEEEASSW